MDYSNKNFTGWDLTDREDLHDMVIEGSCFSHEKPDSIVFPEKMTGVTFIDCNLDNCFIPEGNKVVGGSQRRFEIQNDLNDWIVDENGEPEKPIDHTIFEKLDLPIPDPADIPDEPVEERIDLLTLAQEEYGTK